MSLVAELLLELLGEAVFSRLQRPFDRFCQILNIWMVLFIWLATPLVEWWVFRLTRSHDSILVFYFAVLVAIGWPLFAVIFSIVLFQKTKGPSVAP
jgi:hypothetical protein